MGYRERIYGDYVKAASASLAPETLAGLEGRRPVLARFIADHFPPSREARILELGCGLNARSSRRPGPRSASASTG